MFLIKFKRRTLMATLAKRPNGKWQAKIRKKGYKTLSNTFSRKADAVTWAKGKELKMERGSFESTETAEKTLLSDLLDRFMEEVTSYYKSPDWAKYKINYLKKVIGHFRQIEFTVDSARDYKEYRLSKVSTDTVRKEMSLVKRMIDYSMREWNIHLSKGNPLLKVSLTPKGKARDRPSGKSSIVKIQEDNYIFEVSDCS